MNQKSARGGLASLDATRLVIDNDGWEHTRSDILGAHRRRLEAERSSERGLELKDLLPGF